MISDDERREVAARLRNVENHAVPGAKIADNPMTVYFIAAAAFYDLPYAQGLFARLADLIEPQPITGDTSDGYHTFNELYDHRAKLFSVIVRCFKDRAWKSKLHHDGTMYDGMFIVGVETPAGQATYHYDVDPYWGIFDCEELDRAPEWDGHTPQQAIERIAALGPSCDRNALLELADEMDDEAEYMNSLEYNYDFQMGYSRRIREALGVGR